MLQDFDFYNWVLFPLLIFFARVSDVSLGTLRSVLASKGNKGIVPIIGFFEVLIWLFAITQIFHSLNNNFIFYLAWAAGYATGSYVGLTIEERLALGIQVVRVITNQKCDKLIEALRKENYGLTVVDGQGARGPVKILFTTVQRKNVEKVIKVINQYNPNSFYSIEDVKNASQVAYSGSSSGKSPSFFNKILPYNKGK